MSGPTFTECARTARKRTIGALIFLRLSENLEENLSNKLLWLESQWHVVDSHSAAVCCCSRPMVGLFYNAVPVLADEDKIG